MTVILEDLGETRNMLSSAPDQISIDNKQYKLETNIWRDFMPICEKSGRQMVAVLYVKTVDSSPFSSDVKVDIVWIMLSNDKNSQVWSTQILEQPPQQCGLDRNYIRVIVRDGPKWGPAVNVDVVVQLSDAKKQNFQLQAKRQAIYRTE